MIRHLLKLAWNRKRSNALLVVEITASFLVVFAVVAISLQFGRNALRPLGFDRSDVVAISVRTPAGDELHDDGTDGETFDRLLREARSADGVLAAAGASVVPYEGATDAGSWDHDGRTVDLEFARVTDDLPEVLGLEVTKGRWFSAEDEALAWHPLVVDEEMAAAWFGAGVDAVGKTLPLNENGPETRVVGIVRDFRKSGELSSAGNFLFTRARRDDPESGP